MDDIIINKIEWSAPEYSHKERSTDWFWTLGVFTIIFCGIAIWYHSYLFAIFLIVAGASIMLFSIRHPQEIKFSLDTKGITMGRDVYEWKKVKGFDIKKGESYDKLLIEINKHFLPIYTIPVPQNLVPKVKDSILKVVPRLELEESRSVLFVEKLGF